jgi:hypothetical protein
VHFLGTFLFRHILFRGTEFLFVYFFFVEYLIPWGLGNLLIERDREQSHIDKECSSPKLFDVRGVCITYACCAHHSMELYIYIYIYICFFVLWKWELPLYVKVKL